MPLGANTSYEEKSMRANKNLIGLWIWAWNALLMAAKDIWTSGKFYS